MYQIRLTFTEATEKGAELQQHLAQQKFNTVQ